MNYLRTYSLVFCFLFILVSPALQAQDISLAGKWRFAIDRDDKGITEQWFITTLKDSIRLPGSMLENNKGNAVTLQTKWTGSIYDSSWYFNPRLAKYRQPGNLKFPFWLTPAKYYVGAAWYQKEVMIPASWKGQHITLYLERPHTETRVWIDNKEVGMQNSMVAPHEFTINDITAGKHTITIRIDNRIKEINVGPDSHSLTDHTQGNWNGIVGKMLLQATPQTYIDDIQVYPDITDKSATVKLLVKGSGEGNITITAESFNGTVKHTVPAVNATVAANGGETIVAVRLPMTDKVLLWDEFNPNLYKLTVMLAGKGFQQSKQVQFGMRSFKVKGTQFEVNGRPTVLRGTVENCVFPLTGYAPMDVAAWERIFRIAKSYGLNHFRFHSYCPPEAAFIAADKVGFYMQPEGPSWANHGSSLGDGKPIDKFIYDETNRMAKAYGNYASYCMLAYGNEPRGGHQAEYLTKFIHYWKDKDSRRVYTGASVAMSWPLVPDNEFMIKSGARSLAWNRLPESMGDYTKAIEAFKVPYVAHEMGQYCVYPNFDEIKKYTGVYKAKNFEMFKEDLADQGMGGMGKQFTMASGKLQALCYKYEIEKSMRTPGNGGFQLLALNDYPGQGTALVGILDPFWDEKGYTNAKEFSKFCNSTVPLTRMPKFVYNSNESLQADVEIYHYGKAPLNNATVNWKLVDAAGKTAAEGSFKNLSIIVGTNTKVGNIEVPLNSITKAANLKLLVTIANTSFTNDWDIWVYPAALTITKNENIYYTDTLDAKAEQVLNNGGKVFLNAAGKIIKGKEIVQQFIPVFWNTSWFKMRPPHTTGFVLDNKHPAFAQFPTNNYSTLQWWEIVDRAQVMHLEDFPKGFTPLVQPIDTWFMNRRLALVFEAKVGKGKLIVCSADLQKNLDKRPAAKQLMYSLQQYMLGNSFNPSQAVDIAVVRDLFTSPSKLVFDAYTKDSPDELKPKKAITN